MSGLRLFVAIDLPENVKAHLAAISHGVPGARWVAPEQMHLTLRFIGEVDGVAFQDTRETLAGVRAGAFTLRLDGVGCFPPRGRPEVLWVGVAASPELLHLQKKIETALILRAGLAPEPRKYHPHVTLARLRGTPGARVGRFFEEYGLFLSEPVTVSQFVLYSSTLGRHGALHQVEESYPLATTAKA